MNNPLVQPDPGLYIWTIATFLILLWLLAKFAWRPLLAALEQRQEDDPQVARRCTAGEAGARAAEWRVAEDSRRGARAGGARSSRGRATDANRLRDELKQKAQAEAAGIIKNAERQIEMETARAMQQIRNEAVDISIAIASKLLERNVTKEDNERLIEETFKQIEARRPS